VKTVAAFLAGVALACTVAALLWAWHASDDRIRATQLTGLRAQVATLQHDLDAAQARVAAVEAAANQASRRRAAVPARAPERRPEPAPPAPATAAPKAAAPDRATWDATAAGALESEIAQRFGLALDPAQKSFLVATLARARDASRHLNDTPVNPADPASIREHAAQREALLQADQAFRKQVGMGISTFVQGLSGDKIEEAFPPDPAR
jgi:hypothetical protein